jgi:DNA-directed RNA polymerase sigma subunit (sigma70/sigma32)
LGAELQTVAGEALERVSRAAEQVARLEPRLVEARHELHAAIVEAHREGSSLGVIAKVAGLSRERVRQIVKRGATRG